MRDFTVPVLSCIAVYLILMNLSLKSDVARLRDFNKSLSESVQILTENSQEMARMSLKMDEMATRMAETIKEHNRTEADIKEMVHATNKRPDVKEYGSTRVPAVVHRMLVDAAQKAGYTVQTHPVISDDGHDGNGDIHSRPDDNPRHMDAAGTGVD